jgi:hypothetical protein
LRDPLGKLTGCVSLRRSSGLRRAPQAISGFIQDGRRTKLSCCPVKVGFSVASSQLMPTGQCTHPSCRRLFRADRRQTKCNSASSCAVASVRFLTVGVVTPRGMRCRTRQATVRVPT